MTSFVIRVDANTQIGVGHLMRCLALAEACHKSGDKVAFLCADISSIFEKRIKKNGLTYAVIAHEAGSQSDAEETVHFAQNVRADWVLVDGYHFGAEYQKCIKQAGFSLLVIDDFGHSGHYYADIVLNQNIYADISFYPNRESYTRFLLGTRYALIRKEFLEWHQRDRTIPMVARTLLVSLGGGDPDNVTQKVINALKALNLDDLEVKVVIGGSNPHYASILERVKSHPHILLIRNADNMPELMAWADIAISAGGSTLWELAFMGVPTISMSIADNQKLVVREMVARGTIIDLGYGPRISESVITDITKKLIISGKRRAELSQRIKTVVDGAGVYRLLMTIKNDFIRLRKLQRSDSDLILKWANDPSVRDSAFHSHRILKDEHDAWFSRKIEDSRCVIFIGLDRDDTPVGQIRFEISDNNATVDISVDKTMRGRGYAKIILQQGIENLIEQYPVKCIKAFVKKGNIRSIQTFKACGFEVSGNTIMNDCDTIILSRRCV